MLTACHRAVLHVDATGPSTSGDGRPRVPGSTGCFPLGNEEKQELQEKNPIALQLGWEPHSEPTALLWVAPQAHAHTHPRSMARRPKQCLGFSLYTLFCFGTVQLSCKIPI